MFLAIANIPRQLNKGKYRYAFISSSVTIASLVAMVALEVFHNLLYATNDIKTALLLPMVLLLFKNNENIIVDGCHRYTIGRYFHTSFVFGHLKEK